MKYSFVAAALFSGVVVLAAPALPACAPAAPPPPPPAAVTVTQTVTHTHHHYGEGQNGGPSGKNNAGISTTQVTTSLSTVSTSVTSTIPAMFGKPATVTVYATSVSVSSSVQTQTVANVVNNYSTNNEQIHNDSHNDSHNVNDSHNINDSHNVDSHNSDSHNSVVNNSNNNSGNLNNINNSVTNNAVSNAVTNINEYEVGSDEKQTVLSCPPGDAKNYDCIKAIYGKQGVAEKVEVININITVEKDGSAKTVTVTKHDKPQFTPPPLANKGVEETATGTVILSTGTASNSKPTHHVKVGKAGKVAFEPEFVHAKPGDTVRFTFFPKNHSLTSCHREDPCVKNHVFDSGHKATFIQNSTAFVDIPVSNDKPSWYYRYVIPPLFSCLANKLQQNYG
jgi:plastocyanin